MLMNAVGGVMFRKLPKRVVGLRTIFGGGSTKEHRTVPEAPPPLTQLSEEEATLQKTGRILFLDIL